MMFLVAAVLIPACSGSREMGLEEYIKWYYDADCPLRNEKKIGAYNFISEYRPLDFMAISELKKDEREMIPSVFDSARQSFNGMHYFILKIGTTDASNDMLSFNVRDQQEYYSRVQYFSEAAQRDIYMVSGSDTVNCTLYHFERTYNSSPYNNLVLGFEKKEQNETTPLTLVFNDRVLGNGMLLFHYSQNTLAMIPKLKL